MMRRVGWGAALFALVACVLAGCAQGASVRPDAAGAVVASIPVEKETWRYHSTPGVRLTTPHYRIMTTSTDAALRRRMPRFLEAALHEYMTAFGPLPAPRTRLDTYLMASRPQWELLTQQLMGDRADRFLVIGRGGFASGGRGVFWDIGLRGTFVIAAHEGWHQYIQRSFEQRIPVWLDEGIATYMEGFRWASPGEAVFAGWSNVERFDHLRRADAEDKLVSLPVLLSQNPRELIQHADEPALTYYAQVWALIHFLDEGEEGKYRRSLHELLLDAAEGRLASIVHERMGVRGRQVGAILAGGPGLFLLYFNPDLEEAAAEYEAFVRDIIAVGSKGDIVAGRSPISQ